MAPNLSEEDKKENATPVSKESSEYIDFYKRQCLPKNIRKLGSKLFNMNGRSGDKYFKDSEKHYEALPDEKKRMIRMKFELNKISEALCEQKSTVEKIRKKAGIPTPLKHSREIDKLKSLEREGMLKDQTIF